MTKSPKVLLTAAGKWLALALALPAVALLLALLFAQAISPRSAGQPIAAGLHIAHPAVIAHRGLSYWAPEETRAAYLLARELGADYLEADVQRTRDGVLIALHDDTLDRTTNVGEVFPERKGQGPLAFSWEELQKLDAGSWFNRAHPDRARPSYVGLRILRLEELGAIAHAGKGDRAPGLYLETKDAEKYPGYERELVELLRAQGWLNPPAAGAAAPLIFQSFAADSLARLRALAPAIPRVLLIDHKDAATTPWETFLRRAQELDAGIGPSGFQGWPWYTGPAHKARRLVHHYTINEAWQLRLLRQLGSDGFFTDTADLALSVLGRSKNPSLNRAQSRQAAFTTTGL